MKLKRRKNKVELDKEYKRIRRLINIHTEDMKFYRPPEVHVSNSHRPFAGKTYNFKLSDGK